MADLNERGLKEGLSNMAEIGKLIDTRLRDAERRMTEAESELNALRKLQGFVALQSEWMREDLQKLQEAQS